MPALDQFQSIKDIGTPDISLSITRVPNTERVVIGTSAAKLVEYDLAAEQPTPSEFGIAHTSYVTGAAWTAGGIVSGGYDRQLIWWDPETRAAIRQLPAHEKWIREVVASPDGVTVASVADDMHCKVWDAATGELRFTLDDHKAETPNHYPSMLFAAAFSQDGKLLATGDKVGHVAVWDITTGQKVGQVESPGMYTWDPRQRRHSIGGIRSLAFSRDGKTLAVGGIGHIGNIDHLDGPARVELYDWSTGQSLAELADTTMKGLVEQLWFSPNDDFLFTAGGDHSGFITIYDLATKKIARQEKAHQHLHAFVTNEAGNRLYSAHHGRLMAWSLGMA